MVWQDGPNAEKSADNQQLWLLGFLFFFALEGIMKILTQE